MVNQKERDNEAFGPYLNYEQAKCYCGGISRQTLWRLLKAGEISGATIGSKVVISRRSLDEYLAAHPYDAADEEDGP